MQLYVIIIAVIVVVGILLNARQNKNAPEKNNFGNVVMVLAGVGAILLIVFRLRLHNFQFYIVFTAIAAALFILVTLFFGIIKAKKRKAKADGKEQEAGQPAAHLQAGAVKPAVKKVAPVLKSLPAEKRKKEKKQKPAAPKTAGSSNTYAQGKAAGVKPAAAQPPQAEKSYARRIANPEDTRNAVALDNSAEQILQPAPVFAAEVSYAEVALQQPEPEMTEVNAAEEEVIAAPVAAETIEEPMQPEPEAEESIAVAEEPEAAAPVAAEAIEESVQPEPEADRSIAVVEEPEAEAPVAAEAIEEPMQPQPETDKSIEVAEEPEAAAPVAAEAIEEPMQPQPEADRSIAPAAEPEAVAPVAAEAIEESVQPEPEADRSIAIAEEPEAAAPVAAEAIEEPMQPEPETDMSIAPAEEPEAAAPVAMEVIEEPAQSVPEVVKEIAVAEQVVQPDTKTQGKETRRKVRLETVIPKGPRKIEVSVPIETRESLLRKKADKIKQEGKHLLAFQLYKSLAEDMQDEEPKKRAELDMLDCLILARQYADANRYLFEFLKKHYDLLPDQKIKLKEFMATLNSADR